MVAGGGTDTEQLLLPQQPLPSEEQAGDDSVGEGNETEPKRTWGYEQSTVQPPPHHHHTPLLQQPLFPSCPSPPALSTSHACVSSCSLYDAYEGSSEREAYPLPSLTPAAAAAAWALTGLSPLLQGTHRQPPPNLTQADWACHLADVSYAVSHVPSAVLS